AVSESKDQQAPLLRCNVESEHCLRMTPRIHSVVGCGAFMLAASFSPFAQAQVNTPITQPAESAVMDELKALRQMIEQQSKQIDSLTAQITRLGGELERRNAVPPSAPLAETKETPDAGAAPAPAPKIVTPAGNVHIVVK